MTYEEADDLVRRLEGLRSNSTMLIVTMQEEGRRDRRAGKLCPDGRPYADHALDIWQPRHREGHGAVDEVRALIYAAVDSTGGDES